ncbi:MAG: DinB family protein [Bryobacteraceae bacterium]
MPIIDAMLSELEQETRTTRKLLERLPEDKLSWKPHPKSFSLGQLALHIAQIPGGVASFVEQDTADAPEFQQPEAASRAQTLEALEEGIANAKRILSKMDDARLMSSWRLVSNGEVVLEMPRVAFIRTILLNQIYHHRGQLSVYLRLLEVPVPSVYGPSADELPEFLQKQTTSSRR